MIREENSDSHKNRLTAIYQFQSKCRNQFVEYKITITTQQGIKHCSLSMSNFEEVSAKLFETKSITTKADIKEKW